MPLNKTSTDRCGNLPLPDTVITTDKMTPIIR